MAISPAARVISRMMSVILETVAGVQGRFGSTGRLLEIDVVVRNEPEKGPRRAHGLEGIGGRCSGSYPTANSSSYCSLR